MTGPGVSLVDAALAFCEAPANPTLAERLTIAREATGLEAWNGRWPAWQQELSGDAWLNMRRALKAEGDARRDWAAVLKTQIERLTTASRAAARRELGKGATPPARPVVPGDYWYNRD